MAERRRVSGTNSRTSERAEFLERSRIATICENLDRGLILEAQSAARDLAKRSMKKPSRQVIEATLEAALPRLARSINIDVELFEMCEQMAQRTERVEDLRIVEASSVYVRACRAGFTSEARGISTALVSDELAPLDLEWAVSAAYTLRDWRWLRSVLTHLSRDVDWSHKSAFRFLADGSRVPTEAAQRESHERGAVTIRETTPLTVGLLLLDLNDRDDAQSANSLLMRALQDMKWHPFFLDALRVSGNRWVSALEQDALPVLSLFATAATANDAPERADAVALAVWLGRSSRWTSVREQLESTMRSFMSNWPHDIDLGEFFRLDMPALALRAGMVSDVFIETRTPAISAFLADLTSGDWEGAKARWDDLLEESLDLPEAAATEYLVEAICRRDVAAYDELAEYIAEHPQPEDVSMRIRMHLTVLVHKYGGEVGTSTPMNFMRRNWDARGWDGWLGLPQCRDFLRPRLGRRLTRAVEHVSTVRSPLAWQLIRGALAFPDERPDGPELLPMNGTKMTLDDTISFFLAPLLHGSHTHNAPVWQRYCTTSVPTLIGVPFSTMERWPESG